MSLPQDTLNGLLYKYDLCIIRCLTENSQMTTENAKVFFKIMSMESMLSSVLFDSILFYYSSFELVRLVLFNAICFAVLQAHSQYGHPLETKYRNKKKCYTRLNKAIVSIKKRANWNLSSSSMEIGQSSCILLDVTLCWDVQFLNRIWVRA